MRIRRLVIWFMCLVSLGAWAAAQRVGPARVAFDGHGPAGFRLEGVTDQLALQDSGNQYVFTVPLATLKTGIALRDRHMREKYLQTDRYPQAVLTLAKDALPLPAEGKTSTGTASGQLTLHGQTHAVQVSFSITRAGGQYNVTASAPVKMTDFGIEQPGYFGITVQPDVLVNVTLAVQMKS